MTSNVYRSKTRDEPRLLRPTSFDGKKKVRPSVGEGRFGYSSIGQPYSKIFDASISANLKHSAKLFSSEVSRMREFVDLQYSLVSQYAWLIEAPIAANLNIVNKILFSTVHKGLIAISSSQLLSERGLYGPARPLLRYVFESALIAKYCSINPLSDVFDKWVDGQSVYLTKAVIKKIQHPNTEEFSVLWETLCQFTHSSVYAMQIDLNKDSWEEGVNFNLAISELLLMWLYHILNRHFITRSMEYYQGRYGDNSKVKQCRQRAKEIIREAKMTFTPATLRLAREFNLYWK